MPERTESLGLRTLEDINTIILHSHDLRETLDNIVDIVSRRMASDVCSIYLLDDDHETLRLHSTKGLSRSSVGNITMKISEGLTGLVVETKSVVSLADASEHPRFKYFSESGEERYHSFLGIPIPDRKSTAGVIVVQHRDSRVYTAAEISTLSTIAFQISGIVINARLLDSIRKKDEERSFLETELKKLNHTHEVVQQGEPLKQGLKHGVAVSAGFASGAIYILSRRDLFCQAHVEMPQSPEVELEKVRTAFEQARIHTIFMEKRVAEALSEGDAAIFHTHLMILEDRGFIDKVEALVMQGRGACASVREVVRHYMDAFEGMDDPYLRSRSADMEDIGRRIVDSLESDGEPASAVTEKRIIAAADILPSDLATIDAEMILGIVTENGDMNSHAAIIARSLGIPAVLAVDDLMRNLSLTDQLIIDGNSGHVYINPDPRITAEYERLQKDFSLKRQELSTLSAVPSITKDGARISLYANIGLISDIRIAAANGAEGVGLYRTEFPFMARGSFPTRKEQAAIYSRVLDGFDGKSVTIRTLDIGGDKGLPYFPHPKEENPFMGWRGIRISLDHREIFKDQLAAVMIAAAGRNTRVMFPMISGVDELNSALEIVDEVKLELAASGLSFKEDMQFGIMVETPAAVQTARLLAKKSAFFSIGTNDLIQYTLAADRNNPKVGRYFNPLHPALLHSIKAVADAGREVGIPVSVCGEMAADPLTALILAGMGIDCLSMASPAIPKVKQAIIGANLKEAQCFAAELLKQESCAEVGRCVKEMSLGLGIVC